MTLIKVPGNVDERAKEQMIPFWWRSRFQRDFKSKAKGALNMKQPADVMLRYPYCLFMLYHRWKWQYVIMDMDA